MEPISLSVTAVGILASPLATELINIFRCRQKQSKTAKQKLDLLKSIVDTGRDPRVPHSQDGFRYTRDWLRRFEDVFSDAEDAIYSYEFAKDDNQINNILERIKELADQRYDRIFSQEREPQEIPIWRRTTCGMPRRQIKGRTDEKYKLENWLLNDQPTSSNKNFSVLSIIGTGGIGKTILSQLVFNDQEVRQKFEIMAWIVLCEHYKPIFYIIANESASESSDLTSASFEDFSHFHNKFVSNMKNKRFLMVLDDVWDEICGTVWDTYCSLFNIGKNGSKIIVNTQLEGVANMISPDPDSQIKLDNLQQDEYLELLNECLFHNTRPLNDLYLQQEGHKISTRFGCLPLVAVEIEHQLNYCFDRERWNSIWQNKFCITTPRHDDIISILGLCYEKLPGHLKKCYLSCALFPRNYQFEKLQLNLIWIGMGFVHSGSPIGNYVDDFSLRSFFIDTTRKTDKYEFRPVLHELAEYISNGEFFRQEEQTMEGESIEIPEKARHVYISVDNFVKASEALRRNEKLRSLVIDCPLPISYDEKSFMKSLERVLNNLKSLRFLVLPVPPKNLSKTVGNLKNLRYLQFPNDKQNLPNLANSILSKYKLKLWNRCKYLLVSKDNDKLIKRHCNSPNNIVDVQP